MPLKSQTYECCDTPYRLDSVNITPHNPTYTDSIKIVFYKCLMSNTFHDTTILESTVNDTIFLKSYNTEGIGDVDSYHQFIDTFNIGKLENGENIIICYLELRKQNIDSTYTDYINKGMDTLHFSVSQNGFINNFNKNGKFNVYPNPIKNKIKLKLNDYTLRNKYQLEICSLSGQQLLSEDIYRSIVLDLSDYAPGIYLLTIKHNNKIIQTEKLIVE
ncbi:MAG: T9SS type A sorting domain-containing protein [Bacteroidota bacterium]